MRQICQVSTYDQPHGSKNCTVRSVPPPAPDVQRKDELFWQFKDSRPFFTTEKQAPRGQAEVRWDFRHVTVTARQCQIPCSNFLKYIFVLWKRINFSSSLILKCSGRIFPFPFEVPLKGNSSCSGYSVQFLFTSMSGSYTTNTHSGFLITSQAYVISSASQGWTQNTSLILFLPMGKKMTQPSFLLTLANFCLIEL